MNESPRQDPSRATLELTLECFSIILNHVVVRVQGSPEYPSDRYLEHQD